MSYTLAVDERGDIYLGAGASLAARTDLAAVVQACEHAARTILAEMIYAADQGLPLFEVVWVGAARNLAQFDAYLRRAILSVSGVVRIVSIDVWQESNKLHYHAVILTVYGTGELNA